MMKFHEIIFGLTDSLYAEVVKQVVSQYGDVDLFIYEWTIRDKLTFFPPGQHIDEAINEIGGYHIKFRIKDADLF